MRILKGSKYSESQECKRLDTRLYNVLAENHLAFEELQYISKSDFSNWVGVGKLLVEHTDKKLQFHGYQFGIYSLHYYQENKDYIQAVTTARKERQEKRIYEQGRMDVEEEVNWATFRREASKDILCAIISNTRTEDKANICQLANRAIKQADELIKQLKDETNGNS